MDLEIQQLRTLAYPQHSASASINHGTVSPREGTMVHGNEECGTTPMDIEKDLSNKPGLQNFKTLALLTSKCFFKFCGY
jgi:hypothetical protein